MIQVFISGLDLTKYILSLDSIQTAKTDLGELVEIPNVGMTGDNTKNIFTPGSPNTIFQSGWMGEPVKVYRDDLLIYSGELRNVDFQSNGRRAKIETTSRVNKILNAAIGSYYHDTASIAEISENIYLQYNIPTDNASYERAKILQTQWGLQVEARITPSMAMTVMQAQQWLANAGICRHYFINDTAHMDIIDPNEVLGYAVEFDDSDIIELSSYSLSEVQPYDGYEVISAAGSFSEPGLNQAPTLDANTDKAFILNNPSGAIKYGELQMEISGLENYRITFSAKRSSKVEWLSMTSTFRVKTDRLGIDKVFKVLSIDKSSNLSATITGVTL